MGNVTHREVYARLEPALAIPSVLVAHFHHIPVEGDEVLEVVDEGVFFGESGLSPGGLGEDGEGRERQEEEERGDETVHDFLWLACFRALDLAGIVCGRFREEPEGNVLFVGDEKTDRRTDGR